MFALRLLIIIIVYSSVCSQRTMDNYGPYKVRWKYYDLCSGPKKENLTYISKSLLVENDIYKGVINMTFAANTRIDDMKITVTAKYNSNSKSNTWNYKVLKPCQHYSIAWILNKQLNANNCVVKKGGYYTVIDFTDATYKFFGNKFFYGEYVVKLLVLSNKGNIACFIFNPVFSKT